MPNTMPDRLRRLYEYATTHKVVSLELMLDAATEIEQLQEIVDAYREELEASA